VRKVEEVEATELTPDGVNPLTALETRHGHRVRIEKLAWIVGGVLLFLLLAFIPNAPVVRGTYGALLWLTCLVAGHNGCAPLARERERGGWEELALLPLTDGELAAGKLGPGVRTVLGLSLTAIAALVVSYLRAPGVGPGWLLWGGVSLLLLPASFTALGALAGLLSPAAEEAHWRVGLLSTALPAILLTGMLFGLQVRGAELLSPLFGALSAAGSGHISAAAWIGTLGYAALGMTAAWLLRMRFREWALGGAVG
jgi:hypothetical protein